MNALQKKQIKELIENDCEIRRSYYCNGKTCVIGRLALESGVTPERFDDCQKNRINEGIMIGVADIIGKRFGLTLSQLSRLQAINDEEPTVEDRRRDLLELLNKFEVED